MKQEHLGDRVMLVKPWWMPKFFIRDKNIGKSGTIIRTDIGEYSGDKVCFIAFDRIGNENKVIGVYMHDQLVSI
jgi:hypothetical protein